MNIYTEPWAGKLVSLASIEACDILTPTSAPPAKRLTRRARKKLAERLCRMEALCARVEIFGHPETHDQITRDDWRALYDRGGNAMQGAGLQSIRDLAAQFKAEDDARAALDAINNALEACHG